MAPPYCVGLRSWLCEPLDFTVEKVESKDIEGAFRGDRTCPDRFFCTAVPVV